MQIYAVVYYGGTTHHKEDLKYFLSKDKAKEYLKDRIELYKDKHISWNSNRTCFIIDHSDQIAIEKRNVVE